MDKEGRERELWLGSRENDDAGEGTVGLVVM
jgi:hypothetical protein